MYLMKRTKHRKLLSPAKLLEEKEPFRINHNIVPSAHIDFFSKSEQKNTLQNFITLFHCETKP